MSGKQLSLFEQYPEDSNEFFTRKREWSVAKHRIMLRYIQAFCYSLNSHTINYVDGFAGTGKYGSGIGIEDFVNNSKFWLKYKHELSDIDGSPLIAIKCAKLFRQEKRVNLRCFFVESDASANKELRKNCSAIDTDKYLDYKIYNPKPFNAAFSEIMNDIEKYPTLFFMDTFGIKGFTFDQLCDIGNYVIKNKGDLFLLFHNRSVARHAGYHTTSSRNLSSQKAATTFINNLTELLGSNSDQDWKPKWLELKEQPQAFERWALEYFKNRMRNETGFKDVTSFEIKETYADKRPQYSIVVGSNYPEKAFGEFLNDFIWEEEKLLFYKENNTKQIEMFLDKEWDAENKRRIEKTKPAAIEILQNFKTSWLPCEEAITKIILGISELGVLKRTQYYNEILIPLYQAGRLEIRKPGSRKPFTLKSELRLVD